MTSSGGMAVGRGPAWTYGEPHGDGPRRPAWPADDTAVISPVAETRATPTAPPALTALDALPAVQRRSLVMRHLRGMGAEDIAAADRVAVDVVHRRLSHGELAFAHHLGLAVGPETPSAVAARELAPFADLPDASIAGPALAPMHATAARSRRNLGWGRGGRGADGGGPDGGGAAGAAAGASAGGRPPVRPWAADTRAPASRGSATPARGYGGVASSGAAADLAADGPGTDETPPAGRRDRLPVVAASLAVASVAALGAAVATAAHHTATPEATGGAPPPRARRTRGRAGPRCRAAARRSSGGPGRRRPRPRPGRPDLRRARAGRPERSGHPVPGRGREPGTGCGRTGTSGGCPRRGSAPSGVVDGLLVTVRRGPRSEHAAHPADRTFPRQRR